MSAVNNNFDSVNVADFQKAKTMAEEMKDIRKIKLRREAMVDPSKIGKLIKAETTLLYNSNAKVVQTTGSL
ncbi:MAG: hypothetical protein ACOCVM_05670 [Desulfovibrionaceae bacterium]